MTDLFALEDLERFCHAPTPAQLAPRIGVSERTVARWRAAGGLSVGQADRAAVAAGTHPAVIWSCWGEVEDDADAA